MMDKETHTEQTRDTGSSIKIGDITLISARLDVEELCKHIIELLKQPEVIKYLNIVEQNKLKNGINFYG